MTATLTLHHKLAQHLEAKEPFEAIEAMCQHADARTNVWWGCLCAWSVWRPQPPTNEDAALQVASDWAEAPSDPLRQDAWRLANQQPASDARFLLQATIHSGGALQFEGAPNKKPTPDVAGTYIKVFLHQLLASCPPKQRMQSATEFVQIALQLLPPGTPDTKLVSR